MSSSCATRCADVRVGLPPAAGAGLLPVAALEGAGLGGAARCEGGVRGGLPTKVEAGRAGDNTRKCASADCRMPAMRAESLSWATSALPRVGEPPVDPLTGGVGGRCGCILGLLLRIKGCEGDALRSCCTRAAEGLPARAGREAGAAGAGREGVRGVTLRAAFCRMRSPSISLALPC